MPGHITSTANAILGLLSLEPMSGYDVRNWIEHSIGNFWSESYGQIYPSLKVLAENELIAEKLALAAAGDKARRTTGRERRVYELTAKGRRQLESWLAEPVQTEVPRNELLLKLFFGKHLAAEESQRHVHGFREMHAARLRHYADVAREIREGSADAKQEDGAYWRITLNFGLHLSRAMVSWCDETLAELEQIERARTLQKRGRKTRAG